ncbi:unnamed protein product [Peronospora farinosa]|uniref:ABC transporter substrate-binding protein n=1 Tax=Peronospora farinosa TaxID=134698 RepID=A0AAV0SNV3_9STRA|nr:unnamed protein product [Peronospora farinosa]
MSAYLFLLGEEINLHKRLVVSSTKTRSFVTSQFRAANYKKQPTAVILAAADVAAISGLALTDLVNAREKPVDVDAIKKEIVEIFDENNYMGPTFVRLAWHSKYVEIYAKDENLWFKDFTKAFVKLTENGVKFPESSGWLKFFGVK